MEEFLTELATFLQNIVGFTAKENEWVFETPAAYQQVDVSINGQIVRQDIPVPTRKYRVALVGDAELEGIPGKQILFEVSEEENILMEYEEVFYPGDGQYFVAIFQRLFN